MAARYVPHRGEVVWLRFTPQKGREQAGLRPALTLSPRAYNAKVGLALFCPITSRTKGYPFEVDLPDNFVIEGTILSDQTKSLDWKARKAKKVGVVSGEVLDAVLGRLHALLFDDQR